MAGAQQNQAAVTAARLSLDGAAQTGGGSGAGLPAAGSPEAFQSMESIFPGNQGLLAGRASKPLGEGLLEMKGLSHIKDLLEAGDGIIRVGNPGFMPGESHGYWQGPLVPSLGGGFLESGGRFLPNSINNSPPQQGHGG